MEMPCPPVPRTGEGEGELESTGLAALADVPKGRSVSNLKERGSQPWGIPGSRDMHLRSHLLHLLANIAAEPGQGEQNTKSWFVNIFL